MFAGLFSDRIHKKQLDARSEVIAIGMVFVTAKVTSHISSAGMMITPEILALKTDNEEDVVRHTASQKQRMADWKRERALRKRKGHDATRLCAN